MKRFVLTGAPGAGKTSILRVLGAQGFAVVEEAATDVIAAEQRLGVGEPWRDDDFLDKIVALQRRRERGENAADCTGPPAGARKPPVQQPEARNRQQEARDQQPEAQNRQQEARDQQPEAQNRQQEARDRQPQVRDRQAEAQDRQPVMQDRQQEAPDWQPEAGDRGQVQVFDRSPLCTLALARFLGHRVTPLLGGEVERVLRERVYEREVFFVRPLGFIEATAARRISYRDSLEFAAVHAAVYREHGFDLIGVARATVTDRAAAIAGHITSLT